MSGEMTEVCEELKEVCSRMEVPENCLTARYQPRFSDSFYCDGVRETSFVHSLSEMHSVENSGKYVEHVKRGRAELNYRAPEFRPPAMSSELRNYPKVPVKKKTTGMQWQGLMGNIPSTV
ncbi:hypothetical protein Hamer_G024572 [Homarus americanus]|uniref:Uncharacterized protein n=1 Tax=Homarus americanus TaxID=6706 RepID=A0A8J5TIU2_HOMAM|nr:hypothetical protein Hamer_G024572 [Homarus americanus]